MVAPLPDASLQASLTAVWELSVCWRPDGVVGVPDGVTAGATPDWDFPAPFDAVTEKTYDVPLVSPVTVHVVAVDVQPAELGELVTAYPVTGEPFGVEALQLTTTEPADMVAVTTVGADGTSAGMTAALGDVGGLEPALLIAMTVNV